MIRRRDVAVLAAGACLLAVAAGAAFGAPAGDTLSGRAGRPRGPTPGDLCRILKLAVFPTPGAITEIVPGSFHDEVSGCDRSGCLLLVSGSWSELGEAPAPHDLVFEVLAAQGWSQVLDYSADGPDGTRLALRHEGTLCIIRGAWDGGDDSDPAYVPSDVYQVTIICAREEPCLPRAPGEGSGR